MLLCVLICSDPVYSQIPSMPKSFDYKSNKLQTSDTKWWCSSFYPGSLWMIYENTGDESIKKEAEHRLAILEKEKFYTGNTAETILRVLSTETYRSTLGENGGFLLKHSVGAIPYNSEVDVPLTYADYYFLEALMRYKNWYLN